MTLARATLAVGVAALVADSFGEPAPVTLLVSLSALALVLDAVDGWVARRTRTTAKLGAHFDAEVDAFLILILSVYVARLAGAWVLAIGAARYVFLAAGWRLPWMREQLPPRYWRKVVGCDTRDRADGRGRRRPAAGCDRGRPRRRPRPARRVVRPRRVVAVEQPARRSAGVAAAGRHPRSRGRHPRRPRTRTDAHKAIAAALTVLAVAGRVGRPRRSGPAAVLTLTGFLRVPLEGLVLVALAVVLPPVGRRILAGLVGPVLGLVVILKILDIAFVTFVARPFDPVGDLGNLGTGVETMRAALGGTKANLLIVGGVTLAVVVLVATTVALFRLMRVAAGNRRWSLRAVTALGALWLLFSVFGAQLLSHTPIASTSAAGFVVQEVRTVQADIHDSAVFAKQIKSRPLPQHSRRPAADGAPWQGRPPRVRRVLRPGFGPGLLLLPRDRCATGQGDQSTAGRRLLRSERVHRRAGFRRHQLARALHTAVGRLGQQPTSLQPARRQPPLHAY